MINVIMRKTQFLVAGAAFLSIAIAPVAVLAHGGSGSMMGRMMDMMHGSIERNRSADCDVLSEEELMEAGEGMMEEMMGAADHERVEAALDRDPNDHDAMHTMMGMWATGCVGDETVDGLMERHGVRDRLDALERTAAQKPGWPGATIAAVIGAVVGGGAAMLLRKPR